jgi:hypothetical protein
VRGGERPQLRQVPFHHRFVDGDVPARRLAFHRDRDVDAAACDALADAFFDLPFPCVEHPRQLERKVQKPVVDRSYLYEHAVQLIVRFSLSKPGHTD